MLLESKKEIQAHAINIIELENNVNQNDSENPDVNTSNLNLIKGSEEQVVLP